jgi:hypothetical protein
MPSLIPVREYQPLDPYHHIADNGPIKDIEVNLDLINNVLDIAVSSLADSIGSQPTLAARLDQSLNSDGTLKISAVDQVLHSIEEHTDTDDFVRMTTSERDKLAEIADGATDVTLTFEAESVVYDSGTVKFNDSDSVLWRIETDGVYADVAFPLTSRHRHYYDIKPTPLDPDNPDYQNYTTTSVTTAYVEGSLRVYVNGVRISKLDVDVGAPPDNSFPRISGQSATWVSLNYEEDTATSGIVTSGQFTLSDPILSTDRITVDFDVSLA